jgi:hypothetical protein
LLGDDAQVCAEREADLLGPGQRIRNGVERRMKRFGARPGDLPEQVFLRVDVVVERGLLDAERLRQVGERGAVVAALGEEPGGCTRQLLAPGGQPTAPVWLKNSSRCPIRSSSNRSHLRQRPFLR